MKLAAICCTYKRPDELATAIECFPHQAYPVETRRFRPRTGTHLYPNARLMGLIYPKAPFQDSERLNEQAIFYNTTFGNRHRELVARWNHKSLPSIC